MAEHVRARMTAAKVGVGLAIAGLLAGIVEKVRPRPPTVTANRTSASSDLKHKNDIEILSREISIGTKQIKNHSLLYKDFKQHQVLSYKELKAINSLIKGESQIKGELTGFLGKGDTAVNAAKVNGIGADQLIQGHGNVFSAERSLQASATPTDMFTVPGLIQVQGNLPIGAPPNIIVKNISLTTFTIIYRDKFEPNKEDTVPAGGTEVFDMSGSGGNLVTAQLVNGDNRPVTLTLSGFDAGGGVFNFIGQALVAGP